MAKKINCMQELLKIKKNLDHLKESHLGGFRVIKILG